MSLHDLLTHKCLEVLAVLQLGLFTPAGRNTEVSLAMLHGNGEESPGGAGPGSSRREGG